MRAPPTTKRRGRSPFFRPFLSYAKSAGRSSGMRGMVWTNYLIAVGAGALAVFCRLLIDPLLRDQHPYPLPLLAVVVVAWHRGLGPALVTLAVSMAGVYLLIVQPRTAAGLDAAELGGM